MTDKMWKNIFLSLFTIGTFLHRLTSLLIDCATRVQKCPLEKDQWTQKNNSLKCAANYGYVCLRDSDGNLFETCMANFPVQANSGNCPILFDCKKNNAYLGPEYAYYSCPEEVSGCPPKNHPEYSIHQLYKYPKCIESNFSDETGNTSPISTTSISVASSDDYFNEKEKISVIVAVVIGFLLSIVIILCYTCYIRCRRKGFQCCCRAARDESLGLSEDTCFQRNGFQCCRGATRNKSLSLSKGAGHIQTNHERRNVRGINESEAGRSSIESSC